MDEKPHTNADAPAGYATDEPAMILSEIGC
jgi:hypothetical protein